VNEELNIPFSFFEFQVQCDLNAVDQTSLHIIDPQGIYQQANNVEKFHDII
jgi:hypothetical protein